MEMVPEHPCAIMSAFPPENKRGSATIGPFRHNATCSSHTRLQSTRRRSRSATCSRPGGTSRRTRYDYERLLNRLKFEIAIAIATPPGRRTYSKAAAGAALAASLGQRPASLLAGGTLQLSRDARGMTAVSYQVEPSLTWTSAFLTVFSSTPNARPIARKLIPSRRIRLASAPIR